MGLKPKCDMEMAEEKSLPGLNFTLLWSLDSYNLVAVEKTHGIESLLQLFIHIKLASRDVAARR